MGLAEHDDAEHQWTYRNYHQKARCPGQSVIKRLVLSEAYLNSVKGNEHITYSSPEGERHTINGVEQPSNRSINPPPPPTASQPPPPAIQPPPPPDATYGSHNHSNTHSQPRMSRAAYASPEPPVIPHSMYSCASRDCECALRSFMHLLNAPHISSSPDPPTRI